VIPVEKGAEYVATIQKGDRQLSIVDDAGVVTWPLGTEPTLRRLALREGLSRCRAGSAGCRCLKNGQAATTAVRDVSIPRREACGLSSLPYPEAPPIRPERHIENSIATIRRQLISCAARVAKPCHHDRPFGDHRDTVELASLFRPIQSRLSACVARSGDPRPDSHTQQHRRRGRRFGLFCIDQRVPLGLHSLDLLEQQFEPIEFSTNLGFEMLGQGTCSRSRLSATALRPATYWEWRPRSLMTSRASTTTLLIALCLQPDRSRRNQNVRRRSPRGSCVRLLCR
jgi:hypothetical protein